MVAALMTLTLIAPSPAGASAGQPSAPRSVHATSGVGSARVSWLKPTSSGTSGVVRYVVTSHPARRSCSTATTSCAVHGLKQGSKYSFSVVARNALGPSVNSRLSNRVTIKFSIQRAAKNYLAAVGSFNSSLADDLATLQGLTSTSTAAQVSAALASLQHTFNRFASTLGRDEWPKVARGDVKNLLPAITALGTDTANLAQATSSNASLIYATLQHDGNLTDEDDAAVRADLHLPELISGPDTTTLAPVAIGSPQSVHDFTGDTLTITVSSIVDPATAGADSGQADPGYRFVAVEMSLSNPASSEIDGDANYSLRVIGSDGQTYTADYGTVAECTNFSYGSFALSASGTANGCVVFQLPTAVSVKSLEFTLATGYLDTAVWDN